MTSTTKRRHRQSGPSSLLSLVVAVTMLVGLAPAPGAAIGDIAADPPPIHHGSGVESDIITQVEVVPGYSLQGASVPVSTPYRDNAWVAYYPITKAPTGTHTWEVWSCNDPDDGLPTLTPTQFIAQYGGPAQDWFNQVSGGRYKPQFVAKGSFTPKSSCWYEDPPGSTSDRIMIRGGCCGLGGPGMIRMSSSGLELVDGTRTVEIGTSDSEHILTILIHEMGHGLGWPHIPADLEGGGTHYNYNNLADVMSGGAANTNSSAPTAAFNLYASGWLNQSDIAVWEQDTASFRLGMPTGNGTKLLIVPSGVQGRFHTVEATPQAVPYATPQGVLVHSVDQTPAQSNAYCMGGMACYLTRRSTKALVMPGTPTDWADRVDPVLGVGDSLTVGSWTVKVVTAHADGYTVELTGEGGKAPVFQPVEQPEDQPGPVFDDVPANHTFADAIASLAETGITRGCNPPDNNLFCPGDDVTRGQMAAFLKRFLGLPASSTDHFGDDNRSTFEKDINSLADAGITKGCNPPDNDLFCPDDKVSREQMAAFLVRALGLAVNDRSGFADVSSSSTFATDINRLATAGVTKGCNPPSNSNYCPRDPVTRGQMAAFIHRADRANSQGS